MREQVIQIALTHNVDVPTEKCVERLKMLPFCQIYKYCLGPDTPPSWQMECNVLTILSFYSANINIKVNNNLQKITFFLLHKHFT